MAKLLRRALLTYGEGLTLKRLRGGSGRECSLARLNLPQGRQNRSDDRQKILDLNRARANDEDRICVCRQILLM